MPLLGVLAALHGNVSPRLVPFVDLLMHVLARWADANQYVVVPAGLASYSLRCAQDCQAKLKILLYGCQT